MKKSVPGTPVLPSESNSEVSGRMEEQYAKEMGLKKETGTRKLPKLPGDFDEAVYGSASGIDEFFKVPADVYAGKVMTHGGDLINHLIKIGVRDRISIGWPESLYIPAKADWKKYWILPPPAKNLYSQSWAPTPSPAGYNTASHNDGTLYCSQRIRTIDKYVQSEAGVGVLFTPKRTLSVVSLQPQVDCSGETRWFAMYDNPGMVAGTTLVKTSLILAVWHSIPTGWDLINWKQFEVTRSGPNSGSGYYPITPYQKSFTGKDLATPFLVQSNRTYLFGVVARVSVWSTLTDDRGNPLPLIENGTFRVWGSLACVVPQIEIFEQQVHIP